MKQNRLKSPVLWGAVGGIILLALRRLGFEAEASAGSELASTAFELVCAVIALFGIANNPTDKKNF